MMIEQEIRCGGCVLRRFRATDAASLARHANNPNVAAYLRERFPHPYRIADAQRFIRRVGTSKDAVIACIAVDGEAVGGIGLEFHKDIERCSAELGYWLGEAHWGRGIIAEAIRAFTAWAMPRFELTRVYALVNTENTASARVLEKAGFERIGVLRKAAIKNGVYWDCALYDLVR